MVDRSIHVWKPVTPRIVSSCHRPCRGGTPVQRAAAPGAAPVPARAAVRWWQDPKLTFGPPGDPEFLAKIPHQVP